LCPDTDFGYSLVRFEAEYLESGFGIRRLTPVYELSSPLQLPPEAASDDLGAENRRITVSLGGASLKALNDGAAVSSKEQEQQTHDDDIWSRLPAWAKILEDLKRKARQEKSA